MAEDDDNTKEEGNAEESAGETSSGEENQVEAEAENEKKLEKDSNVEEAKNNPATIESENTAHSIEETFGKRKSYSDNKLMLSRLEDQVKAGDDSLNKLKVQNIDFILDIPLKVSVELGRTKILIRDLLNLGQGSVLELDKLAGDPLEILVNGKLVARGEVVVINEKFGVKITSIVSPVERIETLKK